jgi:hypothetical protein
MAMNLMPQNSTITVSLTEPHYVLELDFGITILLSFTIDDVQGKSVHMLCGPATDVALLHSSIMKVSRGTTSALQIVFYSKDLATRICMARISPHYDGGSNIAACKIHLTLSEAMLLNIALMDSLIPQVLVSASFPHDIEWKNQAFFEKFGCPLSLSGTQSIAFIHGSKITASELLGVFFSVSLGKAMTCIMQLRSIICNDQSFIVRCVPVVENLNGLVMHVIAIFQPIVSEMHNLGMANQGKCNPHRASVSVTNMPTQSGFRSLPTDPAWLASGMSPKPLDASLSWQILKDARGGLASSSIASHFGELQLNPHLDIKTMTGRGLVFGVSAPECFTDYNVREALNSQPRPGNRVSAIQKAFESDFQPTVTQISPSFLSAHKQAAITTAPRPIVPDDAYVRRIRRRLAAAEARVAVSAKAQFLQRQRPKTENEGNFSATFAEVAAAAATSRQVT